MTKNEIKSRIENAVAALAGLQPTETAGLVPASLTDGKLYEAHVLAVILEKFVSEEGMTVMLRPGTTNTGTRIVLRSKGGPISRAYPHFALLRDARVVAELWTDIEFLSQSYVTMGEARELTPGDYHELDIVVVKPRVRGRPSPNKVLLGVECKNTDYGKDMLRQILGVRRELSLLAKHQRTFFEKWPRTHVRASPPSCLVVFSTDVNLRSFEKPGELFGIDFIHESI